MNTEYAPEKIAAEKQALRDELKAECEKLKDDYQALENVAKNIPTVPTSESKSAVRMLAKMPLLGTSVLTQSESWDENDKTYSVSMALVWSPKLQENALSLLTGAETSGRKGKYSPQEWIEQQNLATMIGPRRFNDNEGQNIFVGIAARDLTGKVNERKAKRSLADLEAIKAVAFSLTGDVETFSEAKQHYKDYDDDVRVSVEKLSTVVSQKCDVNLKGCMNLLTKDVTHPISKRKTYVSVYYIDPKMSKDAVEILGRAYAAAGIQTKTMQQQRGQHEGMEQVLDNVRKSSSDFNKGVQDGRKVVNEEILKQEKVNQAVQQAIPAGASGSKVQEGTRKSQGGTFSGDGAIDTNF